jgi:PAS domain S-box-containing protein
MATKPTHEELEQRVRELEKGVGNERVEHLNRVLRAIRNINQLISKERDRDRLVQGACDTLIEARGYHSVWIALLDESRKLATTAKAGLGKDFVAMVERMKHGELTACGRRALSEPGVVTTKDPGSACTDCPLSASHGGVGALTVRLEHRGRVYGLLSASIPSHLVGDEEERSLLREVAGDIAFALHDIGQEETRKQAEKELQESEKRVKDIFVASPVGIGLVIDRRLGWANEAMYRMVGYDRDCLLGESARVLYADQDAYDRAGRELYSGISRSGFGQVETRWVRKDGTAFDCILQACCIDPSDRSRGEIVAAVDISPLKGAQEALRESESQKRAILDASIDRIRLVDRDLRIIWANKTTTRELGITPEELIGKICHEAFVERDTPCPGCPVITALKSGRIEHAVMHQMKSKGIAGDSYWDTYTVPIKDESGHIVNFIEISRNITERMKAEDEKERLEAQLRQSQNMEAISTLAGGIAHDFNNILSAIIGYAQLAQMKLDPESEPYADLKQVLQSGNRAKLLIQQILAVGSGQEQERQPMQFNYIVREVLTFLRSTLPSTIEIQEKIGKDVGVIDADPTQMHQVLMNLCTNAGQAMEENGGILTVSLRNAEIGLWNAELNLEPGWYLKLTVSDTGHGMTPEVMEKIFDPYFTTKEKREGTGIGLSVVHGIVAQHGGAITVESEPGKGSTFHVYLPLTQAEEQRPEPKEEIPVPKGNERILFIEDEAALVEMGKKMLQSLGYDATPMTSSIEALALFRKDPKQFDLVITDTTMPHMPGDILAQELMKIRPDIPVIISTGHSKRISRQKAKEKGIKGFLMKPLLMRELAETVRKALD